MQTKAITLSGEGGVGKDTLIKAILQNNSCQKFVAYTTRDMREGEVDGLDYHFISQEQYDKLFSQKSEIFDEIRLPNKNGIGFYTSGSLIKDVDAAVRSDSLSVFNLAVPAALKLKQLYPEMVKTVMVVAETPEVLVTRLVERDRLTPEQVSAVRESDPSKEFQAESFDLVIVNHTGKQTEVAQEILSSLN